MQEQRKLAAIMFTDIAGYTSLMARNEHLALEILRRNREIIKLLVSQFNGEWLKEMGDGTLSSFGSVVDAVNFPTSSSRNPSRSPIPATPTLLLLTSWRACSGIILW